MISGALVAVLAMVVVLWTGDGRPVASPEGIPDPGMFTSWGLPLSRTLSDCAAVLTVGFLLLGAVLVPARDSELSGARLMWTRAARWSALVWVVGVIAQFIFTISNVLAEPVLQILDPTTALSFARDYDPGRSLVLQAVLAAVVGLSAYFIRTTVGAIEVGLIAIVALLPPSLTGHAGASSEHALAVSSIMIHIVALSLWCGGLWALVLIGITDRRSYPVAVPRFSGLALWCAVAVAGSGVVSAWIRLTSPTELLTTSYGRIVLLKVALIIVIGLFGIWHRRRTVPNLGHESTRIEFVRVAGVEVLVMAATIGVAVALSRTPPPVSPTVLLADLTPTRVLLGFDLPPAPDFANLMWGQARLDGFWLMVVILLGALYLTGVQRLRASGDIWPPLRTVSWFAGLALLAFVTNSGLATYAHVMFSVHMAVHMVESMIVPIFLVLGAPITLALRALPRESDERGARELLLRVLHSRVIRFLSHPVVASVIFVGGFYALYFTSLFPWLISSHWGHVGMGVHFLLAGALFFWVLGGIDPGPNRPPHLARMVIMLVVMPLHAFFNVALMMTSVVLAESFYSSLQRPYATDLLADQHLGGGLGWAMGEVPMLIMMIVMFVHWMRADEREARRSDRRQDRAAASGSAVGDELAEYNAYLARLAAHDQKNK